ncbi:putative tat pathway signal sequence domain protein [Ilyonectria robusta]
MRVSFCSLFLPLLDLQLVSSRSMPLLETRAREKNVNVVETYTIPDGVDKSTAFNVTVRVPGGKWRNIDVYKPKVVQTNIFTGSTAKKDSSMVYFDFSGSVEVSATYNNGEVTEARIRPDSLGNIPGINGASVNFTLDQPRNVVLQINDDIFDVLHIFTNPIEDDAPSADDPDILIYGRGSHKLSEPLNISSGQTLYLAGGSVVSLPGINFQNVSNASIRGRGVLATTSSTAISVIRSQGITIDGVIGINVLPRSYQSSDVTIRNFRALSSVQWGDGIDIFCSKNVFIDNVFMRNSDDCFAIYNHRDDWYGDNSNITLQNSVLWADVAHPINMGTHGNTENPETTDGVIIRNIDILDQHEKQVDYQGCIAINAGDGNLIQNVIVDDVRVEDIRLGQLVNLRVKFNKKYNTSPGRGIRNVTIQNLVYDGTQALTSIMSGYDGTRTIDGVTFRNLTINGLAINDKMKKPSWYLTSDYIPMYVNEHVYHVTFEA